MVNEFPRIDVFLPKLLGAISVAYYRLCAKKQQWDGLNHSLVIVPPDVSHGDTQLVKYSEKLRVNRSGQPWKHPWVDSYRQDVHAVLIKHRLIHGLAYPARRMREEEIEGEECLELIYQGPEESVFVKYPVTSDLLGFEPYPGNVKYTMEQIAEHIAEYVYTSKFPELVGCSTAAFKNKPVCDSLNKWRARITGSETSE
jgi:hypothetical protein